MKYCAILGRQPEFGLTELEVVCTADQVQPFGRSAAILTMEPDINRLGGVQKIGRIIYEGTELDLNTALNPLDLPVKEGKTTFGLSYYGINAGQRYVMAAGLTLKKRLKTVGSIRLVTPQNGTSLSAAQVKFNGLVRAGFELLVVIHRGRMVIALTSQIQDIDGYAARDYQRPARSATVGMLPPKLAQMMVNTTSAPLVYDPFCGTGVVLQEALLLGRNAAGSDINPEMVMATERNMEWLRNQRPDLPQANVTAADARTVRLPDEPLSIVSEGYLGRNFSSRPDAKTVTSLSAELLDLYVDALRNWHGQLAPGGEVSISVPVWHTSAGWKPLPLIDHLSDMGYTLRSFARVDSRNLIYRRPDQIVGRQLLLLRKL